MTTPFLTALHEARDRLVSTAPVEREPAENAVARKLVRELEESITRLEGGEADRDLVSIMCHDLKDPLASIVMGAGFLRKTLGTDDGAPSRVIEAIARSADRMSQVISDFHDLAKLEAGRLAIETRSWDVVAVIRTAMGPLTIQSAERNIALDLQVPKSPLLATCDRARVVQIVTKLVGNALKFTPAQGKVAVVVEPVDAGVSITVTDTGRGIAADRLPTIFDHAANARRTPRDGPGMGLAIVRGLVELQRGEITVQSRVDAGSTFTVILPPG